MKTCDGCKALVGGQCIYVCLLGFETKLMAKKLMGILFDFPAPAGKCPKPRTNKQFIVAKREAAEK